MGCLLPFDGGRRLAGYIINHAVDAAYFVDDTAADYIAEAMMMAVQEEGYMDIEMEELVANREW